MAGELTPAQQEQARAAVVEAIARIRDLRNEAVAILPASSRGRAKIVATCEEAIATVGTAVSGASLGDEPSMWQRAVDAGRRAVETAQRTIEEVKRTTSERLAQLWRTTRELAESAKRKVETTLADAWKATKDAVEAAGRFLLIGTAVISGTTLLLSGLFLWWLLSPSSKSKE